VLETVTPLFTPWFTPHYYYTLSMVEFLLTGHSFLHDINASVVHFVNKLKFARLAPMSLGCKKLCSDSALYCDIRQASPTSYLLENNDLLQLVWTANCLRRLASTT